MDYIVCVSAFVMVGFYALIIGRSLPKT